jgi:hypothetical protein
MLAEDQATTVVNLLIRCLPFLTSHTHTHTFSVLKPRNLSPQRLRYYNPCALPQPDDEPCVRSHSHAHNYEYNS